MAGERRLQCLADVLATANDRAPSDAISGRLDAITLARIDTGAVMNNLDDRCRELLSLHYFDELSAPEISRIFGTTEGVREGDAAPLPHRCTSAAGKEESPMTRHYRRDELAAYRDGNEAIVDLAVVALHLTACGCAEREWPKSSATGTC